MKVFQSTVEEMRVWSVPSDTIRAFILATKDTHSVDIQKLLVPKNIHH